MAGGCIGGLVIAACLMIPVMIKNAIDEKKNKQALTDAESKAKNHNPKIARVKKKNAAQVERDAEQMLALWGSNLETAEHEDKALFLIVYFVKTQRGTKIDSILNNKYVCSEIILASASILEEKTHSNLESKLKAVLPKYFDIQGLSLQMIPDRLQFYHSTYGNGGEDAVINELLLIIPHDMDNQCIVEYNESSPVMLTDYDDMIKREIEVRSVMPVLIDFIDTELNRV